MLSTKEIKETYKKGMIITDCFGTENCLIRHSKLTVSPIKSNGTLVLGGVYIYDGETGNWAK